MIPGSNRNHPTFWRSFGFAVQGFRFVLTTERNIKVMLAGAVAALIVGCIVSLTPLQWGLILLCCGVVLCAELFNTALETVIDLVSPEYHPLAGRAKDISAAAVWILCVFVSLIGLVIFISAGLEKFF